MRIHLDFCFGLCYTVNRLSAIAEWIRKGMNEMKKLIALLLTATMLSSSAVILASCSAEPGETTPASTGAPITPPATTTVTPSTTASPETEEPTGPVDSLGSNGVDDYTPGEAIKLVARDDEWSYKTFSMKFTGTDGDRNTPATYDDDKMAEYMAGYGWELGADTIPQGVLDDVKNWETSKGPFGDNGKYNEQPIGFEGDNHGLMISATFEITDLQELKDDFTYLNVYAHYDNTFAIYINGTLVYRHFTADSGKPDWTGQVEKLNVYHRNVSGSYFIGNEGLRNLLVEGENNVLAMVKDAWGGRVLVVDLECA